MKTVLQIAYDPTLATERHRLLVERGYRVFTARNNMEAQEACANHAFDAILLGYASPLPNRKVMMQWLREHCPGVPIVSLYARQFLPVPKADYSLDGEEVGTWMDVLERILT